MALHELTAHLERIRDAHGGELPVSGAYAEHEGEYPLGWASVSGFVQVKEPDEYSDSKRVVMG